MSNTTDEWLWTDWEGGECPIPDAKAGEYSLKFADGRGSRDFTYPAIWWSTGGLDCWKHEDDEPLNIIAYAVRNPHYVAPAPFDQAALLKQCGEALASIKDRMETSIGSGVIEPPNPALLGSRYGHQQAAMYSIYGTASAALEALRKAGVM